jgi:hypothetical protein
MGLNFQLKPNMSLRSQKVENHKVDRALPEVLGIYLEEAF